MCGYLHVIVEQGDFTWQAGKDQLTEYRFNTRTARHLFCRTCGVKSVYVPRSHPDGYSMNLACLEIDEDIIVEILDFDGRNWERSIHQIR